LTGELRAVLARLIATQVCLHACMTGFRMAAPLMALREGFSPAAVGVLIALFALSQVFLALPAGRYTDRHGLRRPIRLAVVTAVVGALPAAIWPVYPVLCLAALSCGAAAGLALISLQRHVGRLAQGATELKQVFSWMAVAPSISNFLGPCWRCWACAVSRSCPAWWPSPGRRGALHGTCSRHRRFAA